jgi:hypothetical protein
MAGPVNELMAMAVDPNIPIEPMFHVVIVVDVYSLVRTKIEHFKMKEMMAKNRMSCVCVSVPRALNRMEI